MALGFEEVDELLAFRRMSWRLIFQDEWVGSMIDSLPKYLR
jgi:hypothetical protein